MALPQQLYDNAQDIDRFTGSVTLNHRPLPWFSQRLIAGVDYTGDNSRGLERFAPPDLAVFLPPSIAAGQINQTGQQLTQKNLQIQPTITVRPGFSVNVLVTKDMVIDPYVRKETSP